MKKPATFKDKVRQQPDNVNAGLIDAPGFANSRYHYSPGLVRAGGKDQEQHLEMARNFVNRFNHRGTAKFFPNLAAYNFGEKLVKVPSLDGSGKMSKSENQFATLYLNDDDDLIRKKVMRAKRIVAQRQRIQQNLTILKIFFINETGGHQKTCEKV